MSLFLIETQLQKEPYSLSDIKSFYQRILYDIEGVIQAENETILSGFTKAEELTSLIKKRLEELQTFEKIKKDKQNDASFDEYVTQKEYEYVGLVFVLLQRFSLIYANWRPEDVDNRLYQQYLKAYDEVMVFFVEYESFNDLLSVIRGAYSYAKKNCDKLLGEVLSFYPSSDDTIGIIEESKSKAKEYIHAVDDLEYIVNFCIDSLITTINTDEDLKAKMIAARESHKNSRDNILKRFFSLSERQEIEDERYLSDIHHKGNIFIDSSKLAEKESVYFTSGIDSTDFTEDDIRWTMERKERIIVLLELIDKILDAVGMTANYEKIIDYIAKYLLNWGARMNDFPNLKYIIFTGFCTNGVNSFVDNFNSFIGVRRTSWESALKSSIAEDPEAFYKETLWEKELKEYLDEINSERMLKNETVIPYPDKYINNFAVNAKFNRLSTKLFESGNVLSLSVRPDSLSNVQSMEAFEVQVNFNGIYNNQLKTTLNKLTFGGADTIRKSIETIYANQTLPIYSINEFIPYIVGHTFSEERKSGIFHWYIRYSLTKEINYYAEILEQASILLTDYSDREGEYAKKYRDYKEKYENAQKIYDSYAGSDALKYYKENTTKKQEIINNATLAMETAWNEFILALDKGYTEEVERGMYV